MILEVNEIQFQSITKPYETEARTLILEGLRERFGYLNDSFNPDLKNICETYNGNDRIFLIGLINGEVTCTGSLSQIDLHTFRIERMSVKRTFRRYGLGKKMLEKLEIMARGKAAKRIVLETNNDWDSALTFYRTSGYTEYENDGECIHFYKKL